MKIMLSVDQPSALRAGKNYSGDYVIDFDPAGLSQEQRDELAQHGTFNITSQYDIEKYHISRDANGVFYLTPGFGSSEDSADRPLVSEPTLESVRTVLDWCIMARKRRDDRIAAEKQAQAAEARAALMAWVQGPADKFVKCDHWGVYVPDYPYTNGMSSSKGYAQAAAAEDPRVAQAVEDAEALAFWLNLDNTVAKLRKQREEKDAAIAMQEAKKLKREKRRLQVEAWVHERGTPNQQARLKDGFLRHEEIINEMQASVFKSLDDAFTRFSDPEVEGVCAGVEDYEGNRKFHDIEIEYSDAQDLDADGYDRLQQIRELSPKDAQVKPLMCVSTCSECDTSEAWLVFEVKVQFGDFTFTRKYEA